MRAAVRRGLTFLTILGLGCGGSLLASRGAYAVSTCAATTTTNYIVQVCLTAPNPGSTLTGLTTVSGSQSVTNLNGSTTAVGSLTFTLNGQPLLTSYSGAPVGQPYTFTWHTFHWVDGTYTLGVWASMTDGTTTQNNPTTEPVMLSNGVTTAPTNSNRPTISTGTVPAAGQPLIVGALGSGADGQNAANIVAAEVAGWSPNLFLFLGDVYERGTFEEFYNWYDNSRWGSMRAITNPTPGDQEVYYGLDGYEWYWNNEPLAYSWDAGGWHFISLTGCDYSTICSSSGTEISWLNSDLAAHPGACTIAYWHEPRWALDHGFTNEQALWAPLANSHATAVVNADVHNYQRWTAMDANGNASTTGTAEFIVATANHAYDPITTSDPRAVATVTNIAGALRLSLTTTTASFQFIDLNGKADDSGGLPCQGNGTLTGLVTDAPSGSALAGATVSYTGTGPAGPVSGSATTDPTGRYTAAGIAVSSYTVTAQASGHVSQTATAVVGGGSTTTQNFALNQTGGTLTGTVTDARTAQPIAGASVSAGTASTTSSASGQYTLAGLTPGTYTVTASATGYTSQSATAAVTSGTTTTQNFALTPNPGTITGTLTDANTALAISGATLSYSGGSTTTDSTGHYTLSNVTEGTYTLTAAATGYASQSKAVTIGPGATVTQNFAMAPPPGTLAGTVTDSGTAQPIAGATVSAGTASATTNASGQYTLSLPPGSYTATASASGYTSQSAAVSVTAATTTTQNFALAPNPGTIIGTVTDGRTAAPLSGATVSYSGGTATTDSAGHYTLSNVVEGTYSLTGSATAYISKTASVTVGPGASVTQNFALTQPAGAIAGTVSEAGTGKALGGATVSYSGGSATADANGQYTLANVPVGTYTVTAAASGYTSQSQSVTVTGGVTATANFGLRLAPFFSDGFESGTMNSWTSSAGLTVQTATVHSGTYAAEGSTANGNTYALKSLSSGYQELYYRTYFDIKSQSTGFTLMGDQTATSGGIVRLYVNPQSQLVLWNDVTQLTTTGPTVSLGTWHSVELHVVVSGLTLITDVWLDGNSIPAFSTQTTTAGLSPVGQVQLGSQAMLQTYDVVFDDVALSTARIGP